MKKYDLIKNIILTVLFVGILWGLALASVVMPNREFSESENRMLAQKPKMSIEGIINGEYEDNYEEYIKDQFVFRDEWITLKTKSLIALGKKDINGVYICSDNYLIDTGSDLSMERALSNSDKLTGFLNDYCNTLGNSHVSIMMVPTASYVLKDKLPQKAYTFDQKMVIDYVAASFDGVSIDVSEELTSNSDDYIFYKTDHHWTSKGAFLAYEKYMKEMGNTPLLEEDFDIKEVSEEFLGTLYSKINYANEPDSINIYYPKKAKNYRVNINNGNKIMDSLYDTSFLDVKDKYSVFLGGNNKVVVIESSLTESNKTADGGLAEAKEDNSEDTTLLVIKDSYAHAFVPFLTNHYEKIVMIDLRYLKMPVSRVIEEYNITDILALYNVSQFAKETSMGLLQ